MKRNIFSKLADSGFVIGGKTLTLKNAVGSVNSKIEAAKELRNLVQSTVVLAQKQQILTEALLLDITNRNITDEKIVLSVRIFHDQLDALLAEANQANEEVVS